MNIVLLITGLGMGGAEKQVCDLADQFAESEHRVLLLVLTGKSVIKPKNSYGNIQTIELNMHKNFFSFIQGYKKTRSIINNYFKPNLVHSHMMHANIFARLLRLTIPKTSFPFLISSAHSMNEGGNLRMLAYKLTNHLSDISTNVSIEAVKAFVEKNAFKEGKMIVMPNGVDTEYFDKNQFSDNHHHHHQDDELEKYSLLKENKAKKIILSVGRLTEAKDYPNLFHALKMLKDLDFVLLIIGIGELEFVLKDLVKKLKLTEQIIFLGLRRNVAAWMNISDLYVMSSKWEGLPLVILEAMSMEMLIVSTDCGGIKELILDKNFLCPIENSELLAQKIYKALNLPDSTKKLIQKNSREFVQNHYSLKSIAQKWLNIYQQP